MIPQDLPDATHRWGAPQGMTEEQVATLSAKQVKLDIGVFFKSEWKPTPEELEALNAGASVVLAISAPVHPVVALGVKGVSEIE